ncbi:hypothetical protein [Isachenkonia alkalipeptolytica]|uniref:Uncharacterized protein n=1 Tax=Isachenkonia alkalipeptolytica TaxID=2565777 RepID=A0AA43XMD3_9CLOT|nr:hypothetical protein [Isachenkonia alkalipeptolytica]NBG89448.1 hypothetical protein [Isachenkonia alkalipeptolytica]
MDKINEIFGEVSPGFERVRMEYQNNFKDKKELRAACIIYYQGEMVVDLWGATGSFAFGDPKH